MNKVTILFCWLLLQINSSAQEPLDTAIIQKIKAEGLQRSKVMDIAFQLTDVNGPRLTNSPGYLKAANYAKDQLTKWGLTNSRLETFGEFGKGWELERCYIAMKAPYYKPLIAFPRAWTKGTGGLQTVEVMLIKGKEPADLTAYKGKLKNKVLIVEQDMVYKQSFEPDARRYTEEELKEMHNAQSTRRDTTRVIPSSGQTVIAPPLNFTERLKQMAKEEGAIAVLNFNFKSHDGTLFVGAIGGYKAKDEEGFTDIMLSREDYMTTVRLLKSGIPVNMDIDIQTKFLTNDLKGYNVIAEISGSDPDLKEEVVMIGAHLDSWHSSTGATDNAAGVAVMMEAIRILKAIGVQPKRTIRIALWGGEEQGLLGSRGYVRKTFVDSTGKRLPVHEKFSAYYNLDNGTGKIRGIYLQGNEAARSIFTKWFEPFASMGANTITIRNTGSTDHTSFTAVGLPGFQFIQDPIEYSTRTHHSNVDSYDHLIADDLKTSAVIIASIVYHTAMRKDKIPRK
jgi:carboxypeptidase Q